MPSNGVSAQHDPVEADAEIQVELTEGDLNAVAYLSYEQAHELHEQLRLALDDAALDAVKRGDVGRE